MHKRIVLFDIDGTLLVTRGAGKRSLERAFLDLYGIAGAWGEVSFKGLTDAHIFGQIIERNTKQAATREQIEALGARYLHYFQDEIYKAPGFELMAGAVECVKALAADTRYALGVETGNIEAAGWHKLRRAGVDSHFQFGGFGFDALDRADIIRTALARAALKLGVEKISLDRVLVIGDAQQDIIAAKKVGIKAFAVLNQRGKASDFDGLGADRILESFQDTGQVIEWVEEELNN